MRNFTIYRFGILNSSKEEQLLSQFNGTNDLLQEFNHYYKNLFQENVVYTDNNGKKRTFSVSSNIEFDKKQRTLITDLDSAFTGEKFEIRNGESNGLNYSVSETELQCRKLFSFLHIPKNSKSGYVVFENKPKHGVKIIFEKEFNRFLKEKGFDQFRFITSPGLNFNYLSNMIKNGKLKKVRLINHSYSQATQLSLWGDNDFNLNGEETTELKFPNKVENNFYKIELGKLFFLKMNHDQKINFVNRDEVDEISFEINYRNSSKTFHVKNWSKMRSNIDVSGRLDFVNEEPTHASKKIVAMELINEILDYKSLEINEEDVIEANILEEKKNRAEKNAMILLKSKLFNKKSAPENNEAEKNSKSFEGN
jgi:hypothetical protein